MDTFHTRSKAKTSIFVTGATGFLGGHFLRLAYRSMEEIRCLTRNSPRCRWPGVRWVRGDILAPRKWEEEMRGCRTLVHLATCPLLEAERDPLRAADMIVGGWSRLMECAFQQGVQRFIVASSAEVYGSPSHLPISERTPLRPRSIYGFLKACADLHAIHFVQTNGISLCILRFFNLYGLAVDASAPGVVLRLFAERLLRNEPIVLHASLRNSRDFLHVTDAAQALMKVVRNSKAEGVFNIGSGQETCLKDAAERLAHLAQRPLVIDFRPKEGRLRRAAADIRRARRVLGFEPKVTLDQGLHEVLDGILHRSKKKPR